MRLWLTAFASLLLTPCVAAHADTVYTLENQAGTGSYGTVTINSTTGSVSGLTSTQTIGGLPITFTGVPTTQSYNTSLDVYQANFLTGADYLQLNLVIPSGGNTLVGYTPADSAFCGIFGACDYELDNYVGAPSTVNGPANTYVGNLIAAPAATVTPEPSSIALFGTGLLGMVGVARRRFARGV